MPVQLLTVGVLVSLESELKKLVGVLIEESMSPP